ncbi:MAG: PEP-CTERM sorting domain-containing protein, partial [Cyanobacteria bacterium SBLK]|nr:PEP-CTERM sorting domain-containing protein [Cyanobacteria bacterium SBLK]
GDTVTLNVFSDLFSTNIGSSTFTITPGLPDPNLETLFVNLSGNLIRSASIVHSGSDGGTGIDNITFTRKVPEPSSLLGLLVLGTLGLGLKSSRKPQK